MKTVEIFGLMKPTKTVFPRPQIDADEALEVREFIASDPDLMMEIDEFQEMWMTGTSMTEIEDKGNRLFQRAIEKRARLMKERECLDQGKTL